MPSLAQEPAGFFKRKTTWTAIATIAAAALGAKSGEIDAGQAAQMIATALLGLTLRSAIAKQ
jgi:hypothetical protein